MPPYLTPTTEAALINAASSMTVEFMRQMHDFSSRNPEKRNDYLNEKFISYYFRNILAALRQNYIDDLRDVISP